ncbi:hypothetical protein PoB_001403900 [Plakobranchus ocellatus]|uniref:Uncharacterized protein n=1 Tax=Plakobranchus ocellatus TaxID=259542 RepID=A0AAV3Z0I1_9GAST|nr:hypothetical protein PoB_001403900 [Plakobranchus ocellatus]
MSNVHFSSMYQHVGSEYGDVLIDYVMTDFRFGFSSKFQEEAKTIQVGSAAAHSKAKHIYETLCSHTAQLCSFFLKFSVKVFDFEPFLTKNLVESPQIPLLDDSMQKLMREVLYKFTKPCAMANKLVFDVEYNLPYN